MKKIFTLVVALFVMTFCAKAQVVFSDDFENYAAFTVDPTGSWTYYDVDGASTYGLNGATWTNQYYVGSGIVMNPSQVSPSQSANWAPHSGNQFFAVWDAVPSEIVTGTTTNDWLVTPELTLTDAAIVSFYAREVVATYGPEEVRVLYSTTTNAMDAFTELQTLSVSAVEWTEYTFNIPANTKYVAINVVSDDVFGFFMDDFTIFYQPTEPTIQVPATMNFATIMATTTATMQTNVVAYNLTSAITATTAAPFAVSADGTNFATTASLSQNGGTLYVQYAPTVAGIDNGTVELESGSASATITLTGSAFECGIVTLPYFIDFSNAALNSCWTVVDVAGDGDADGYGKFNVDPAVANDILGEPAAMYLLSATDTVNNANDWLISPVFAATANTLASFDYSTYFWYGMVPYPEKFSVYVIPEGQTYATATQVVAMQEVEAYDWTTQMVGLSTFAGQNIQLAIKCESDPLNGYLAITNVNIEDINEASIELSVDEIDFGTMPSGTTVSTSVEIMTMGNSEDLTVTAVAPFAVSLDGNTFASSVILPATTAIVDYDTIYVQFASTTAGTFTDVVEISNTDLSAEIDVTAIAVECNVIDQFPFTESFEETSETLPCWTVNDANNDGKTFVLGDGTAKYSYSSVNVADDWLISPEIALTGEQYLSFDYHVGLASYPETFQVFIIQGETETALTEAVTVSNTADETFVLDLSEYSGNCKIGIHCISDADMYYFYISAFAIQEASESSMEVNPTSMSFSAMAGSVSSAQVANVSAMALTEDITVTVTAPFQVSLDGTTYSSSCTIANAGLVTMADLYVNFNPTAAGSHSGTVTLTSDALTANIAVSGTAFTCDAITSFPFIEDFSETSVTRACWQIVDANGDDNTFFYSPLNMADGTSIPVAAYMYSEVENANDWLISPELVLPANMEVAFDYLTPGQYGPEAFSVYVIPEGQTYEAAINIVPTQSVDNADFVTQTANLAAYANQTVRVAIQVESEADKYWIAFSNFTVYAAGTGIQEVANNSTVVYPNPANNVINVNSTSNINGVEIYTIAGQKVANYTANGTQTAISVSNLSNGMYLMKINTENGTSVQKFNVVR